MQTLNSHFKSLTGNAFARHGFAAADLVAQWPEIAGSDIASLTEPKKIAWPAASREMRRKQGGTLILRTAAGRAMELAYESPRLIERINRFFGYAAIACVKFEQGSFVPPAAPMPRPPPDAAALAALDRVLSPVADPPLHEALRRLGIGMLSRKKLPEFT